MQFLLQQLKPNFSSALFFIQILLVSTFEENMNDIQQLYCASNAVIDVIEQKTLALSLATLVCVSLKVILYQWAAQGCTSPSLLQELRLTSIIHLHTTYYQVEDSSNSKSCNAEPVLQVVLCLKKSPEVNIPNLLTTSTKSYVQQQQKEVTTKELPGNLLLAAFFLRF